MEQKAFDLIVEKVDEALKEQGFKKQENIVKEKAGNAVVFIGENSAYSILYNTANKRFELRSCEMTDEGPTNKWKNLSVWLFDSETDSISDAESIMNDFVDTVQGPKRIAAVQQTKKKRKKDEDNNSDPIFFFNRMVGVFPELKEDLNEEKTQYGEVRPVTFAKKSLLPKVESLAQLYPTSDTFQKMCTLLNDLYANGDLDVRSIITMVILNGIQDEKALANIEANFSEDLKKSYKCGRKLKGKTVKPEKKKKRKNFMASTLNEMNNR